MTAEEDDRAQRRADAAARVAGQERLRARETAEASAVLAEFVERARNSGLPPEPLRARTGDGRHTYRTALTGWYLKRDRTLAVGTNGAFYVLTVPRAITARLRGVVVAPSDPPLHVGRGARDGESMDLRELVRRRLDAGQAWS